ncbi:hypothetical protein PHJA_001674600 [Phtheirospermum japonicum]|uniref:Uncharacterized protein n=1 Tax=Phtheirospermum japonicum TaxID=374723 RepID=A0A830CHB5_9LAMI|nr:hypothetical protein PHJA_001674600 [Phtheirospermum japonicum]
MEADVEEVNEEEKGEDHYAAGKCNVVVSKRKTLEIRGENKIGGRKMISGHNLMKMANTKKEMGIYPRKSRMLRENYEASFVAFNADYRGPRRHPPKNN